MFIFRLEPCCAITALMKVHHRLPNYHGQFPPSLVNPQLASQNPLSGQVGADLAIF